MTNNIQNTAAAPALDEASTPDNRWEPCPSRNRDVAGKSSDRLPPDLTADILSRLPAKSLVRFQCVSKHWSSIIRSRDFADSFFTRSLTRPRLLVAFKHLEAGKRFFFSSPHPPNPDSDDQESSSAARHDMTITGGTYNLKSNSVRGLICCIRGSRIAICNPSTRQFAKLPEIESNGRCIYCFFGYDPICDQYKVVCVMMFDGIGGGNRDFDQEHLVFTLGSAQQEWRRIENVPPYRQVTTGVCINGVLYYGARKDTENSVAVVVSFDVWSEKFGFIRVPEDACRYYSTLVNYQGKLGCINYQDFDKHESMDLWVLEDAEKREWSHLTCHLPPSWKDLAGTTRLSFPGCTLNGEIMMVPNKLSNPFYVSYYDPKRESIRRAKIEGIMYQEFRNLNALGDYSRGIVTVPDHVESIMFL